MENICIMYTKALLYYIDKSGRILLLSAACIRQTNLECCYREKQTQISTMIYKKDLHDL